MTRKIRVMLVDGDESFRTLMKTAIEQTGEYTVVAQTGDANRAVELGRKLMPDVLILEATLPEMDGFALLEALEGVVPVHVMVSGFCIPQALTEAMCRGIQYFLPKPFPDEALLTLLGRAVREAQSGSRREQLLTVALREIGMPAHLKGHRYVYYGTLMTLERPEVVYAITKELYPSLARKFETTGECVERSMRTAIERMWEQGNIEAQQAILGRTLNIDCRKPANNHFIAAMAEYIRQQEGSLAIAKEH